MQLLDQYNPSALPKKSAQAVASILDQPKMQDIWARYHYSQKNKNPFMEVADELKNIDVELDDHPELLVLMTEIVSINENALGKEKKDEAVDITYARNDIRQLSNYLKMRSENIDLPKIKDLPEEHREVIRVMKDHAGQIPVKPITGVVNMFKEIGHHVVEEAKEQPKSFVALLSLSLAGLWFMNAKLGNSAANYVDPSITTVTEFSMDDMTDPNVIIQTDPSMYTENVELSCHDHLNQLVGENAGDFIREIPGANALISEHCDRLKTFAPDAEAFLIDTQSDLIGAYDWWNSRIGFFTEDPATQVGNMFMQDSLFKDAYMNAAHQTAEFIYKANTVENIALHGAIFVTSTLMSYKLMSMDNEEAKEGLNTIKDFAVRSVKDSPLSYAFATAGGISGYMMSEDAGPIMIWTSAVGAAIGEFTHKKIRQSQARNFVLDTFDKAKADVSDFAKTHIVLKDPNEGKMLETAPSWQDKLFTNKKRNFAVAITAMVVAADMTLNNSQLTGSLLGGSAVSIPFLFVNIPEDAGAHVIFGAGGAALGFAAYLVKKTTSIATKTLNNGARDVWAYISPRHTHTSNNNHHDKFDNDAHLPA